MKKVKVVAALLTLFIVMFSLTTIVMATQFQPDAPPVGTNYEIGEKIAPKGDKIIGAVQVIGNIIAVVMLIVIGIKYMVGSAEDKASYKKSLVPYLVGAVFIFLSANLAKLIYDTVVKF